MRIAVRMLRFACRLSFAGIGSAVLSGLIFWCIALVPLVVAQGSGLQQSDNLMVIFLPSLGVALLVTPVVWGILWCYLFDELTKVKLLHHGPGSIY